VEAAIKAGAREGMGQGEHGPGRAWARETWSSVFNVYNF